VRRSIPSLLALLALLPAACGSPQASPPAASPTPSRPAPALVQVENDPHSHPQYGLQKADIVYEYLTEGGITRFTLVYFDPHGPDRVEPVRSARLITLRIQKAYQGVIVYSGASTTVQGMIDQQHVPAFNEGTSGLFSRDPSRPAPHNLMTTEDQIRQVVDKTGLHVSYQLPKPGEPSGQGQPAAAFGFQQTDVHHVSYSYSAPDKGYQYSYEGGQLTDAASGKPVIATNVVLVRVAHHDAGYTEDVNGADGIDFDFQGTGPADVYTEGKHFAATWDLSAGPLRLLDAKGRVLPLPAGLTWIHLIDTDLQVQAA
jgi:hypothetical protein